MSRKRKYPYNDVYLSEKQIKRLNKGFAVIKHIRKNGNVINLSIKNQNKDRKLQLKILNLKRKIVELENEKRFRVKRKKDV